MSETPKSSRSGKRKSYNVATPDLILDSAENRFSERGYEAVTLNEIARDAGIRVGQIVYHFGQKKLLLRKCILRRASILNRERTQLLENYKTLVGENNVELEPLIRAYSDPYLTKTLNGDVGWQRYTQMLGRFVWNPNVTEIFIEAFNPVARQYLESLRVALPNLSADRAARGFQFFIAILYSCTSNDRRIEALSDGKSKSNDIQAYYDTVIPLVVGGFNKLSEAGDKEPTGKPV